MQIQEEQKWAKKWSQLVITPQILNSIIKLQKLFRLRKVQKKNKKMMKYRKNIINQLIKTEQTYLFDISLIISDFKFPMKSLKLIDEATQTKIFGYIQQIKKLNQEFYSELYNRFQHYNDYMLMFDETITKLVPYFKIYFQYIKNYEPAQKLIISLKEKNPQFKKFLDLKQSDPRFRGLAIDSFLIKPIQRLPKYVILLKDLVKHTPDWHPDFQNIKKFLQVIQKVNSQNNQSMNKLLNNLKMTDLQRNLGVHLIHPGRQFICQQAVNILSNNKMKDILMYLFTDLILLTQKSKGQEKVHNQIFLSRGSFCKDMKDLRYFKNLFTVTGNDGRLCTFVCSSQKQKQRLMDQISTILDQLNEKQVQKAKIFIQKRIHNESVFRKIEQANFQVQVDVLGTEQRSSSSIMKYTIYIVQVKIKSIKHKIFIRFSQLLNVQDYIVRTYPQILEASQLLHKSTWFRNHENKVIQQRKLQIQEFMQSILSKRQIRQKGDQVLVKLGLPEDFYYMHEKIKTIQHSSNKKSIRHTIRRVSARSYLQELDNSSSEDDSEDQLTFKTQKQRHKRVSTSPPTPRSSKNLTAQQLLYANEMALGHFTRLSQQTKRRSVESAEVQVFIMIPSQKLVYRQLSIKIDRSTRIQHMTIVVSNKIGLKYFKDFRFLLKEKDGLRVLDDDQILQNLGENSSKVFKDPIQLHFQKFIYVHPHLQQKQIKEDRVRLTLLSNQILIQIKQSRFRVCYQDYLVFACLYMILNGYQPKTKFLKQIIQNILPDQVFFQLQTQYWINDIQKCYGILMEKLKSVYNQVKKKRNDVRLSSILQDPEHHLYTADFSSVVRITIINQIQKHFLYGVTLEIVQISQHTRDYLRDLSSEALPTRNIWLGLKYDKLMLISADLSHVLMECIYEDNDLSVKCQPHCIRIATEKLVFKLKTTRSYFISELIQYYLKYMELYQRIDKDKKYSQNLILRAREQMKSIVIHEEADEDSESVSNKMVMRKQSY